MRVVPVVRAGSSPGTEDQAWASPAAPCRRRRCRWSPGASRRASGSPTASDRTGSPTEGLRVDRASIGTQAEEDQFLALEATHYERTVPGTPCSSTGEGSAGGSQRRATRTPHRRNCSRHSHGIGHRHGFVVRSGKPIRAVAVISAGGKQVDFVVDACACSTEYTRPVPGCTAKPWTLRCPSV